MSFSVTKTNSYIQWNSGCLFQDPINTLWGQTTDFIEC